MSARRNKKGAREYIYPIMLGSKYLFAIMSIFKINTAMQYISKRLFLETLEYFTKERIQ